MENNSSPFGTVAPQGIDIAQAVGDALNVVFSHLDLMGDFVATTLATQGSESFVKDNDGPLHDYVVGALTDLAPVIGMGVAFAQDIIATQPRRLAWWQPSITGIKPLRLNLDPASVDVYEYPDMDWFRLVRDGRQRVAFGPYVDYSGSNEFTVTMASPISLNGRFLGVAGADLSLELLENRWLELLRESALDAALLNSEHHVVLSNCARWATSDRLRKIPAAGSDGFLDVVEVPGGTGWVVALADRGPHNP